MFNTTSCCAQSLQMCPNLCEPVDVACQAGRQEHWDGLPCPPPGDFIDPGIKPMSPVSPALQADSLPTEPPGKPTCC